MSTIASKNTLRYRFGFVRAGVRRFVTDWREHMITDAGMNSVSTYSWVFHLSYMLLGTAVTPTPVRRDGGSTTFSQSGNTITASGNFFEAGDVGRLFKFGSGTSGAEAYITGRTSETSITVSTTATIASDVGTIWYVNTAALSQFLQASGTAGSNGGDNGTTVVDNVLTHKRTITGSALVSPATITEIGFSRSSSNSDLFDRDIISPPVSLLAGDIPIAVIQLIQTYEPGTQRSVGNVGTSGIDTSGTLMLECIAPYVASVATNGTVSVNQNGLLLEPACGSLEISAYMADFTQRTTPSVTEVYGGSPAYASATKGSYTSGSFAITNSVSFTLSQANGSIYAVGLTYGSGRHALTLKFTAAQPKTSAQVAQFTFRKTWRRVLTN